MAGVLYERSYKQYIIHWTTILTQQVYCFDLVKMSAGRGAQARSSQRATAAERVGQAWRQDAIGADAVVCVAAIVFVLQGDFVISVGGHSAAKVKGRADIGIFHQTLVAVGGRAMSLLVGTPGTRQISARRMPDGSRHCWYRIRYYWPERDIPTGRSRSADREYEFRL